MGEWATARYPEVLGVLESGRERKGGCTQKKGENIKRNDAAANNANAVFSILDYFMGLSCLP